MQITLSNTGKRYNREWIFRGVSCRFDAPRKYAITGSNGSGKSTLLQVIAGSLTHTEGTIEYSIAGQPGTPENLYRHIAIAAPYLELIEEMTALEMIAFHTQFKSLTDTPAAMLEMISLTKAANRQIRYYSSGMKQRLKLALAFFSKTDVLLLDEPTTNLDAEGVALYLRLIERCTAGKLVLISSNDKQEYSFCDEVISIMDYKQA